MNTSKEKPIFTEGEYAVFNMSYAAHKRGTICMVDTIIEAENDDQYAEVVIPYRSDDGKAMRKLTRTWCRYLEHLPDEAMNCMDIQAINTNLMAKRGPYEEYLHRNKVIKETSTERLIEELKCRDEFNEMEPTRIIFNDPATIVFWNDGSKTVVKCTAGQKFSEYYGYLAAMAKKIYSTNGVINRLIKEKRVYGDKNETPKRKDLVPDEVIKQSFKDASTLIDQEKITLRGDTDGDWIPFQKEYYRKETGFDIEFRKRRKANEFFNEVETAVKTKGRYLLSQLIMKKENDNLELSTFAEYGWDSMDGIIVQKLAPDQWKVIFPPAKHLRG